METINRMVCILALGGALAGCQGSALEGWGFAKKKVGSTLGTRASVDGMIALEEGRAFLRQGHISAAVASFRIARLDRSTAADANNGLGVAYAKLGRMDLADRYFRTAMGLDPSNERYAANLLRMQSKVMLAARSRKPVEEAPVERIAEAPQPKKAEPVVTKVIGTPATRVVHITTKQDLAPAPQMTVAARDEGAKAKAEGQARAAKKEEDAADAKKVALLDRLRAAPLEVVF